MPLFRLRALYALCLLPAAPAFARDQPPSAPPAASARSDAPHPDAPHPDVLPQTEAPRVAGSDILVEGSTAPKSDWRRAETAHFLVTSDGSEAELKRVAMNLERLHHLLSRLYLHGDASDDTAKLRITLFASRTFFDRMGLRNLRSAEGPYAASFAGQRYYDPREDGAVLAVARVAQIVDLNTPLAEARDCDAKLEQGAPTCFPPPYHPPLVRSWEGVLYSGVAQHFLLTHMPAAYPRWYLDGVGALFSTFAPHGDGSVDYAQPPEDYQQIFRSYGDVRVRYVLDGRYFGEDTGTMHWTPYHAWLLAHYFLYSDLKPARREQFRRYMAAVARGVPMAEAAGVFGDMTRLQREILAYAGRTALDYAHSRKEPLPPEPLIVRLSLAEAATIPARIEIATRLQPRPAGPSFGGSPSAEIPSAAAPPAAVPPAGASDAAPPAADARPAEGTHGAAQPAAPASAGASAAPEAWIAGLRATLATLPFDADATLFLAEAECRVGENRACLASAERLLARTPDEAQALGWKGMALTGEALDGPAARRDTTLAAARATLERAIRLDEDAPLPRIAYFQSFTRAGERAPEAAMLGMARASRAVPAAPAPRLDLARELARQGRDDLARPLLLSLLLSPYDSPESAAARTLLNHAAAAMPESVAGHP